MVTTTQTYNKMK